MTVAGAGSGSETHLTPEVKNEIENSDLIFAASRFKNLIPDCKKFIELKNFNDVFKLINESHGRILILVSGDSGLYSLLPLVKKNFPHINMKILPGISSLQLICSYACETWNDAKILSGHGRFLSVGRFLNTVERNRILILFCDKNFSPQWACQNLISIDDVEVFIGENLGSPDEKYSHGKPCDFAGKTFSELSIMLIKNNNVYVPKKFLRDSDFIRDKNIVMTNENVRAVILSKFDFNNNSVFWDIGAGSGSVSVCVANENPDIEVHSIEHKIDAVNLISQNVSKFHLHNINLHHGRASEIIKSLPNPTDIFIGGSGGELKLIFDYVKNLNAKIKIVIACVTLENFCAAYEFVKDFQNFECVQVSITLSKNINSKLTLMNAKNPVMILCGISPLRLTS